jgi:uncharacterized protein
LTDLRKSNGLIGEKSPYLLQHAYNPVNWHPWGEDAFARATSESKPIFLSIGYATCHWCHVMERESFENDATAAILNDNFVSIKVDREERPDVDRVYMTALQAMGENGGWPMSMFLTPELKPFFGGTYFPPKSQYGRIGFPDLLLRIADVWKNQRDKILQSADGIVEALRTPVDARSESLPDTSLLETCFTQLDRTFDQKNAGFGQGTKFPRPSVYSFLMRYEQRSGLARAREMTEATLEAMARGGMHDHVGGGFHRYSVDPEWRVPHFEKMLYDQAQIVIAYLEAYQRTREQRYSEVARSTLDYVTRDMSPAEGGFYSAEDADSALPDTPEEMGEGAFYVWTRKEIQSLLSVDIAEIFTHHYGVLENGNVQYDPHQEFIGKNVLHESHTIEETAATFKRDPSDVRNLLASARTILLAHRSTRPRPLLDDKILCSWNGFMISAFARASQVLSSASYRETAGRSAAFIRKRMYDPETGALVRRFRDGVAGLEAHLDDYAFLVQGLLDLFEATSEYSWLEWAMRLTEKQIALFHDTERGGFYDTSGRDPSVLVRMKEQYDGAEPTGNSIAVMNLVRLAEMTGKAAYRDLAAGIFTAFGLVMQKQPIVLPQMVAAFDAFNSSFKQVLIAGERNNPVVQEMLAGIHSRFLPHKYLIVIEGDEQRRKLGEVDSFYATIQQHAGKPTAYICEGRSCRLPVTTATDVAGILDGRL